MPCSSDKVPTNLTLIPIKPHPHTNETSIAIPGFPSTTLVGVTILLDLNVYFLPGFGLEFEVKVGLGLGLGFGVEVKGRGEGEKQKEERRREKTISARQKIKDKKEEDELPKKTG